MMAKASFSDLEQEFRREQVRFLTDHGDKNLLTSVRTNVRHSVERCALTNWMPKSVSVGVALFAKGYRDPRCVYVTYGTMGSSYILMVLQWIFRGLRQPRPHVIFDCLWEPRKGLIGELVIRARAFLVNRVVTACVVYGISDRRTFHGVLGIDKEKLRFVPYHHTLASKKYDVVDGDYVFSGGTDGRDYETLMQICEKLAIPLKIATLNAQAIGVGRSSDIMEVRRTTDEEFRLWMAQSRMVVLPMHKSILRTGGHQTFLNAMLMGKAVVVTSVDCAEGYIVDGATGLVVPLSDRERMENVVSTLYRSPELRSRLGAAARQWVIESDLTQAGWVGRVYRLAARAAPLHREAVTMRRV